MRVFLVKLWTIKAVLVSADAPMTASPTLRHVLFPPDVPVLLAGVDLDYVFSDAFQTPLLENNAYKWDRTSLTPYSCMVSSSSIDGKPFFSRQRFRKTMSLAR